MNEKPYTERRLFSFTCVVCKNKRQTVKRRHAKVTICSLCRVNQINENQLSIFSQQPTP